MSNSKMTYVVSGGQDKRLAMGWKARPQDNMVQATEGELRITELTNAKGGIVFTNRDTGGFTVPKSWSILAGDILAEKYAAKAGCMNLPDQREVHFGQVINRVAGKIAVWGLKDGYFDNSNTMVEFQRELEYILVDQYGAFNSPVWFNCGLDLYGRTGSGGNYYWDVSRHLVGDGATPGVAVRTGDAYTRPQCSACFILKREDNIDSIFQGIKDEARLFKYGSGAGSNFSAWRSKFEYLSGGGTASGLMSFLRVYDTGAGSLKSGGTTRRAAKMVVLNDDHPEVFDLIKWKSGEEKKVRILLANGYSGEMEGEAYMTVSGQNSNNSIRISDQFMQALTNEDYAFGEGVVLPEKTGVWAPKSLWSTRLVTTGAIHQTFQAADLWRAIAVNTWECGDPGVHFGGTINEWHTCPNSGPILSSNPCCLTRDMRVDTSEGRISIERLCEMFDSGQELPLVFAYDRDNRLPVLRPIKRVWVAGRTKRVVEVTTQRGLKLRCTPEHRFLLHDGTYVEAQNLVAGVRLRKIGRSVNDERSDRKTIVHRITPNADNGCEYQNRWMWEQANGPIPEGYEVHHLNGDCTDDRLSNFGLKTVTEHRQEHGTGEQNPMYIDAADALLVETWEAVARMNNGRPSKVGQVTVARWNRYVRENGLQGQVALAKNTDRAIRGMSWGQFESWIGERQLAANDRVAYVRALNYVRDVPVYDLEVEGTNNFAITDATSSQEHTIVVHNSEYFFLDDTACNLASLNLLKYIKTREVYDHEATNIPEGYRPTKEETYFDVDLFQHHCRILFLAQEILVGLSSYPTAAVAENSYKYRPLGLGHCNGGLMLMTLGIPYDSEEGRALMGAITSLMTGTAYHTSTMLAQVKGPFEGYEANKEPFMVVMEKHHRANIALHREVKGKVDKWDRQIQNLIFNVVNEAHRSWNAVIEDGPTYGFRNAQATVLAPTGTIGFLMGAETTGLEPLFSIVMWKKYAGGSLRKIICEGAMAALSAIPDVYDPDVVYKYVLEHGHVVGSGLPEKYWPIFATAGGGKNEIRWEAHVEMMAVCQPFLSGAISKTINMPNSATVEDIEAAYLMAYQKGLKAVAIYRDGSKNTQPLNKTEDKKVEAPKEEEYTHRFIDIGHSNKSVMQQEHDTAVARVKGRLYGSTMVEGVVADGSVHPLEVVGIDEIHGFQLREVGAPVGSQLYGIHPDNLPTSTAPTMHKYREKMEPEADARVYRLSVAGQKLYIHVGLSVDGKPLEVFVRGMKMGGSMASMIDTICIGISCSLQYGMPLKEIVEKYTFVSALPAGAVQGHKSIKMCTSIIDLVARILGYHYLGMKELGHVEVPEEDTKVPVPGSQGAFDPSVQIKEERMTYPNASTYASVAFDHSVSRGGFTSDAPPCDRCGHITQRNGTCYRCTNCGNSMGCS